MDDNNTACKIKGIDIYNDIAIKIKELEKENKKLNNRIEKAVEYGNNCLELLKEQENYICESIDIVELLKMIHKNYIEYLNGRSDE